MLLTTTPPLYKIAHSELDGGAEPDAFVFVSLSRNRTGALSPNNRNGALRQFVSKACSATPELAFLADTARLRHHPVDRSHPHRDIADAGAGRMRACAIACQASRCARMSSSAVLSSASLSSARATRCRSSASAITSGGRAVRQGISDRERLAEGSSSTASIS
jgi:hypothetical protein